jgi:hypothetical protein
MSFHPLFAMSDTTDYQGTGRYARNSHFTHTQVSHRQTLWPASDAGGNVSTLRVPLRMNSLQQQNKRWTGAFDNEARASRMSVLADDTLFPRQPPPYSQHKQWASSSGQHRETWSGLAAVQPGMCSGESDVEKRGSWAEEKAVFEVAWEDNDVENPLNFASRKKWANAMILALAVFMVSIASSGFSQGE